MKSTKESLCRICLAEGATIPIFEDTEIKHSSNSSIQSQLTVCLKEKLEDVVGYPRYICTWCQVTLNTVYEFINKYKETCKLLQNSLHVVVKQENIDYDNYNGFVYPEDDTIENFEPKLTKKEIKIEFEDGAHFITKVKPLCKLKTDGKRKAKSVSKVQNKTVKKHKITYSKNKTNLITSSLLEEEFVWNGEDWCPASTHKILEDKKPQVEKKRDSLQHKPKAEKRPPDSVLCETCGETFKNRDRLRTHEQVKHKNLTVTCPTCKAKFGSQIYLNRHFKRVHGIKHFFCSKCGKGFGYQKDLTVHNKVVHEKLAKLKTQHCKFCDQAYTDKKSLLIHERSAHTGDRPAACTVCEASFFHEDYLKEHMRLHTGERPFACPVCARGYAQRGNMKSHMRNHRISQLDQETLNKIKPSWYRFMKP